MENLKYLSTHIRQEIVAVYCNFWNLDESHSEQAEEILFGNPGLRRVIDAAVDRANNEVDRERYSQFSEAWYRDIIRDLPGPEGWKDLSWDCDEPEKRVSTKTPKDYIKTVEGYKQFRDKVDEILLEFDFNRVHDAMKYLDWSWGAWTDRDCNEHYDEVPDIYALRKMAQKLLIDAVERGMGGTGGFETTCYVYEDNEKEPDDFEHQVCLALDFVVESYGKV